MIVRESTPRESMSHTGDDDARDARDARDDLSSDEEYDDTEVELRRGERRHRDAFRRQMQQQRRRGYQSKYRAPDGLADPWEDARGHEHFGIDVEAWRENLERLRSIVNDENEFTGDEALPPDPPELEFAKYKCRRNEFGEAAITLRRLLAKQKRTFRRENRRALEGPSERELRMTEEQRRKFFKPRVRRSSDALEVQVSRTLVALADVEVLAQREK